MLLQYFFELFYFFILLVPPTVICTEKLLYTYIGADFVFPKCSVISNPPARTSWERGYGTMSSERFTLKNGSLEIKQVHISDEGFYVMTTKNYLGMYNKFCYDSNYQVISSRF